ncbi:MAG: molecular chaperone DnaK [Deltaproteobacteria bacterium]|nr:molecular chaperone DnaK [Deltaproteobacteria bacterium]
MARIIGIDLGTTNSCVAVMEGSEPVVIPNSEGARTTPSLFAVTQGGERLVGQIAKRQAITNPENTIYAVKRLMGRKFDSGEIKKVIQTAPYKLHQADNGDAWVVVQGKPMSPPEVSAQILAKMKQTADDYLGEEVNQAVVTTPAYFNDSQRQATKDAGKIAGLDVQRIINEPTAAALAYGMDKKGTRIVAVYDLGGGTFDISILELSEGVFEVKATNGDTYLGGEDFDQVIINFLADEFQNTNQIDLRKDRMALQRLKEAAEKAKHELSSAMETDINLPFICADQTGPKHLTYSLGRDKLEELTGGLIERTIGPVEIALKDAGLAREQISEVILVGGMTRMPRVQERVKEHFGRDANKGVNPDEVVAIGAAIQGAVLTGAIKNVLLLDVTPLSLGVETMGGVMTKIIDKNTTIPCKKGMVFSTAADNQPAVSVHVLQGEREMASDNKTLGRFELVGIPPAPRGVPQIEVGFDIDANGIVHVAAKDLGTGKQQSIRIVSSSGLNQQEIERMIKEAESSKDDDRRKRTLADMKNNAEGLIYTTEKSIDEYAHVLTAEDVKEIKEDLQHLKAILDADNQDQIKAAITRLEQSSHKIAEAMYAEAAAALEDDGAAS